MDSDLSGRSALYPSFEQLACERRRILLFSAGKLEPEKGLRSQTIEQPAHAKN